LLLIDDSARSGALTAGRGHRAIGVVYHPEFEHYGNYVPTVLPRRYDAFMYLEESRALHPLHMPVRHTGEVAETYPTGM
jgi:erythromycin esterase-like protein